MKIELTVDPDWVRDLREEVRPFMQCIVHGRLFSEMGEGKLSIERFRAALLYFYPLIEDFPKYMALTVAKVPEGDDPRNQLARTWLLENMNVERRHADWYRSWAIDFGVAPDSFRESVTPPAPMDGINNFLWRITTRGSLCQALAAVNFGIEGPTGEWTRLAERSIRSYVDVPGVEFGTKTLTWLKAHAAYDDAHPDEAIEVIKRFALTPDEQRRTKQAAIRSMEYYAMAADACYDMFG